MPEFQFHDLKQPPRFQSFAQRLHDRAHEYNFPLRSRHAQALGEHTIGVSALAPAHFSNASRSRRSWRTALIAERSPWTALALAEIAQLEFFEVAADVAVDVHGHFHFLRISAWSVVRPISSLNWTHRRKTCAGRSLCCA